MEAVAAPLWSLRRVREPVALAALAGMVALSGLIVAGAESRLGVLVPSAPALTHLPHDPVRLYRRWATDLPSPYGPLFVVASYAVVPLGVAGALWTLKVVTAAASLAIVWLVWKCAERLDRDPLRAALFVGLNPIVLLFGVGGAHNDFLAIALVMAGVYLAIAGRERLTGAALIAAAAIKLPTGLPPLLA